MKLKVIFFSTLFLSMAIIGKAQNAISGIVVDSLTLTTLPGVHIKVKNSARGTVSNDNGSFLIMAADFDTLVFTLVGYYSFEYALIGPEADILIRMNEKVRMLKEVTTTAAPIKEIMEKKEPRYKQSDGNYIKTPSLAEGISSPFTYFSKTEHEKRKLLKLRAENRKIKTYVDVVNDPELKKEMMKTFSLKEKEYYDLIAKFNQFNRSTAYISNPEEIKLRLFTFIKNNRLKK
jgi:hypothetical protein